MFNKGIAILVVVVLIYILMLDVEVLVTTNGLLDSDLEVVNSNTILVKLVLLHVKIQLIEDVALVLEETLAIS